MIPVFQTTFGDKVGNCYSACLASLLHLSIDEVPNFCCLPEGVDWPSARDLWLADRGLFSVNVILNPKASAQHRQEFYQMQDGVYVILAGKSPKGVFYHCVVGQYRRAAHSFEVTHDPNPDKAGLETIEDVTFIGVLDPSAVIAAYMSDSPL